MDIFARLSRSGNPLGEFMKNVGNRVTIGCAILSVAALVVVAAPAFAQKLTYTPTSPTFGGNPFNSSHLLGVANGQNDYKDPESKTTTSQSDLFASQLESRLLSAFSAQLTDAIFGENAQQSGTFTLGDQTVTFNRDLENVNIQITNGATGELTNITVPLYLQVN